MAIGIRDEHDELRLSVQRWIESRCPPGVTRAALDAEADRLPDFWADLGAQGTLGIHLPEEFGGQGAGMTELAVVAEELGRAAAPGPWAGTAIVGAVVAEWGSQTQAKELLPVLADGTLPASLVVPTGGPDGSAVPRVGLTGRSGDDGVTVDGTIGPIPNGGVVGAVLAPVAVDGEVRWVLLDRGESVRVEARTSFDPSRRSADWVVDGTVVPPERLFEGATAERHPPARPAGGLGRGGGRGPLVPGHRGRARPDPSPVRPAHRPVPGGQAPPGRHAGHRWSRGWQPPGTRP